MGEDRHGIGFHLNRKGEEMFKKRKTKGKERRRKGKELVFLLKFNSAAIN